MIWTVSLPCHQLTIPFISDPTGRSLVSVRASSCRTRWRGILRPQIDAILDFTAPLSDYRGRGRTGTGIVDELKIKIYNSSGADFATLNSHEFNVSCVPNQVRPSPAAIPAPTR